MLLCREIGRSQTGGTEEGMLGVIGGGKEKKTVCVDPAACQKLGWETVEAVVDGSGWWYCLSLRCHNRLPCAGGFQ